MDNKFKKGLILGSLLAVGAAVGYLMTKDGQELTEDLQKDFKVLSKNLKKRLGKLEDVTKENFEGLVEVLVEEYSDKKQWAADIKEQITKALRGKWQEMEEEYLDEKDQDSEQK